MSSSAFDATLACEVGHSRALRAAGLGAWAAAGTAGLAALGPWPGGALALLALAGAVHDARRLARTPGRLFRGRDGAWRLGDPDGPAHTLDPASWSTPWLIVLTLHGPGGCTRVAIARDALDAPTWRRLRARLRVAGPGPGREAGR